MKKLLHFVLWPALAGLVFAAALLALPVTVSHFPELERFLADRGDSQDLVVNTASYNAAIRKAAPAVVSINSQQLVEKRIETYDVNNPFQPLYLNILNESNSLGSGVIINPDGYIITSYHIFVTPGSTPPLNEDITVTLHNDRTVKARLLHSDQENDLALLKVDEENLPFISLGQQTGLEVGDVVLAIGNPRNIGQSVSLGIISALLRRDDSFVIQTDAAINPGNSGGALIDVVGNLIGINSTIVTESGGSEGIGFATPAREAIRLLENYLENGPGGYLGIDVDMYFDQESKTLSVNLVEVLQGEERIRGILVTDVFSNGPAEKAGISCGDVVTAIDGMTTETREKASNAIVYTSSKKPGEKLQVEVFRNGGYLSIPVTLGVGEPALEFLLNPGGCTLPSSN